LCSRAVGGISELLSRFTRWRSFDRTIQDVVNCLFPDLDAADAVLERDALVAAGRPVPQSVLDKIPSSKPAATSSTAHTADAGHNNNSRPAGADGSSARADGKPAKGSARTSSDANDADDADARKKKQRYSDEVTFKLKPRTDGV
jgi:hypothetical protein